ncbi:MAG: methyltransferase, partial [Acidimicrobiia bacterium]|nr:methyltransferase [Acidimicrobiia bacterium]
DSLRAQILKLHGYKCDVIEFVGDEHTPRNSMIRAIATGAKPEPGELDKYREITELFSIRPKLAELLNFA